MKSQRRADTSTNLDPILFSVVLGRLNNIVNEMAVVLERSACTSVIALCHDFSCAIYDVECRQLCMYDTLPSQTASLNLVLEEIARTFRGEIEDGDVFACNDPYRFNSHIGDLVTATPVFVDGVHVFWSVSKGHQMDTGAYVASSVTASARNVYQEGIRIPPLKIYSRGAARNDVIDVYLTNVRYRDLVYGDLLAQIGSISTGKDRLTQLVSDYGMTSVNQYIEAILNYADRRMSQEIESIPDGDYYGEGWVDSDGYNQFDIPIRVKVTIAGDHVMVDCTGSGPQGEGGVNGSYATCQASGKIPFMLYIDPDIPHNHGCLKHIEVYAPPGTICNANFPAATSAATIAPADAIQDAVNKAMASAIPGAVPAGGARCGNVAQLTGVDNITGEQWGLMEFNNTVGSGAARGADGWPLYESVGCAGGLKIQAIEEMELLYPLLVEEMEVETDSMGFGTWNGGPGVRFVVRPIRGSMECITFGDGYNNPPHGVLGGTPGIGGGMYVLAPDGSKRFFSATAHVAIESDEVLVGIAGGGGGYGTPLERDIELVREEVRDGFVSSDAARRVYGVVLTENDNPQIDADATSDLRNQLAASERPLIDPTEPSSATWLAEHMADEDAYLVNPRPSASTGIKS